ncbi:MAG: hypothetical protein KDI64_20180 [Candidatus Accumulibacter sp.]|nr:hypothetical protein [Accumulibacter sp.]
MGKMIGYWLIGYWLIGYWRACSSRPARRALPFHTLTQAAPNAQEA